MSAELLGIDAETMDLLIKLIPLLIPLIVIQYGLMIFAVVDIARKKTTKNFNMTAWILIVCFLNMIGPILYFVLGRADSPAVDDDDI